MNGQSRVADNKNSSKWNVNSESASFAILFLTTHSHQGSNTFHLDHIPSHSIMDWLLCSVVGTTEILLGNWNKEGTVGVPISLYGSILLCKTDQELLRNCGYSWKGKKRLGGWNLILQKPYSLQVVRRLPLVVISNGRVGHELWLDNFSELSERGSVFVITTTNWID